MKTSNYKPNWNIESIRGDVLYSEIDRRKAARRILRWAVTAKAPPEV